MASRRANSFPRPLSQRFTHASFAPLTHPSPSHASLSPQLATAYPLARREARLASQVNPPFHLLSTFSPFVPFFNLFSTSFKRFFPLLFHLFSPLIHLVIVSLTRLD